MNPNEPRLINQPTSMPTRKVQTSALTGALVTLLIFGLSRFNIEVPPDVIGALVVALSFSAAYYTKNEVVR